MSITRESMQKMSDIAHSADLKELSRFVQVHSGYPAGLLNTLLVCRDLTLMSFALNHYGPNIPAKAMSDVLYSAIFDRKEALALMVVEAGADVSSPMDIERSNALMLASAAGMARLVPRIIERGVAINAQNVSLLSKVEGISTGQTALMMAAQHGRDEVVNILLKAGASVNVVGKRGKTALDFAGKSAKNSGVRDLLLKAGAKSGKELRQSLAKPASGKPVGKRASVDAPVGTLEDSRRLLEKHCGSKSRAYPAAKDVWFCHYKPDAPTKPPSGKAFVKALDKLCGELAPLVAPAGCLVIRTYEASLGIGLCVLEAKDKFEVVKKLSFWGRKWGVSNQQAIAFLKRLDKLAPFELTQCGRDILSGRFAKGTKAASRLAKELHKFCPFVAMDFDDDVKALAMHLEKGGEFTLGWD